jgi:hypothetical protein
MTKLYMILEVRLEIMPLRLAFTRLGCFSAGGCGVRKVPAECE